MSLPSSHVCFMARAFYRVPEVVLVRVQQGVVRLPMGISTSTHMSTRTHLRSGTSLLSMSPSHGPLSSTHSRAFSCSPMSAKWEGRKAEENTVREGDTHNVQHDASREGKAERERGKGSAEGAGGYGGTGTSRASSQESGDSLKKAKEEFPEAPDAVGMQDERGQKD